MRQFQVNEFFPGERGLAVLLLAGAITLTVFRAVPAMDTATASLFCSDLAARACFVPLYPGLADAFRRTFFWVPILCLVAIIIDIARGYVVDGWRDRQRLVHQIFVTAAFFVGPLLIVNGWLKALSGRPRPHQTLEFGGTMQFMPVGDFTGACTSNCSFVSGEAAAAGWLLCAIPLLHGRFRTLVAAFLIDVSVATPLLRVAMGGHYLSDAILGWLIGAGTCGILVLVARSWKQAVVPALDKAA